MENQQNPTHKSTHSPEEHAGNVNLVAIIVGKWAMPTTVTLVLITCLSGYFLEEAAFTPVVGMIAPVVMALIMVIKEASVGKDEDPGVKDRENERKERQAQYVHEQEFKLAQLATEEKLRKEQLQEQARQFDATQSSNKEFVNLIKEMNGQLAQINAKGKSTKLAFGDTKIHLNDGSTEIETPDETQL